MDKTMKKTLIEVELRYLDLPFESLRRRRSIVTLAESIETQEQIMPVIVVPSQTPSRFTLIDGYARLRAIKKLAHDTVIAELWECSISEALLSVLADKKNSHLNVMEEALLLKTIHQSGLTPAEIADQIGKHRSWVSRRLLLVDQLPPILQAAILAGDISAWAALRILLPVARATPAIIEQFLQYLKNNPCTTRELKNFFNHYHQSNQKTRADMINTPEVFFKMIAENKLLKESKEQFQYLETQWQENLGIIYRVLKKLIRIVPDVFSSQQSLGERGILLEILERVDNQMEVFKQTLHEVLNATSYNPK